MSEKPAISRERINTVKERLERHLKPILVFDRDAVATDMPHDTQQRFLDALSEFVDFIWKDEILRPRLSGLLDRFSEIKGDVTFTGALDDLRDAVAGAVEAVKRQIMASDPKVQEVFSKPAGPHKFTWAKVPSDGQPHSVAAGGFPVLANADDSYERWLDRVAQNSAEKLKLENVAALLPMEAFTQVEADDDFELIKKLGESLREVGYMAETVGIQLDADVQKHFEDADDATKRLDDHINYHLKNEGVHAAYHLVRVYAMYGRATYAEEIIDPVAMPVIREWQGHMEIFFKQDYWQRLYDIGCAGAQKVGEVLGDYLEDLRDGCANAPHNIPNSTPSTWPGDESDQGNQERQTETAEATTETKHDSRNDADADKGVGDAADGIRCLITGDMVASHDECDCKAALENVPMAEAIVYQVLGVRSDHMVHPIGIVGDDPRFKIIVAEVNRQCAESRDFQPLWDMMQEAIENDKASRDFNLTFEDLPDEFKKRHHGALKGRRLQELACLRCVYDADRGWQVKAAAFFGVSEGAISKAIKRYGFRAGGQ